MGRYWKGEYKKNQEGIEKDLASDSRHDLTNPKRHRIHEEDELGQESPSAELLWGRRYDV